MRRLLSALSLSCLFLSANAQQERFFGRPSEDLRRFYGGFSIGAAFSQVDGDDRAGYNKIGLHVGPVVYGLLSDNVALSLGINFIQKGCKVRELLESPYVGTFVASYDIKLNYVELPLELHYLHNNRLHYNLGISYARLISSSEEAYVPEPVNFGPGDYSFKPTDLCWNVGFGYQLYKHLFATGRFSYSLQSIRDYDHTPPGWGQGFQRNNLFTFRLMYLF